MPLNIDMPPGEYAVDVKVISERNSTKTTKINFQIQNYKNTTYGISQVKLIFHDQDAGKLTFSASIFLHQLLGLIISQGVS